VWTDDRIEALEREAFERGVASSRKESEALERACAALEAGAAGLRRTSHARLLAHRELMLDLAAEIATAWTGRQLALDRELLARVLDRALESVRSQGPDRLLLSVEDAASLLEAAEERVEHWRTDHRLELVEEPSLQPGEFRIEAHQGSVDGRRETVRTHLREVLAEALGEQTAGVGADGLAGGQT
jgi:flagellar biosynthesis/type III secretory pathway protein FliH